MKRRIVKILVLLGVLTNATYSNAYEIISENTQDESRVQLINVYDDLPTWEQKEVEEFLQIYDNSTSDEKLILFEKFLLESGIDALRGPVPCDECDGK